MKQSDKKFYDIIKYSPSRRYFGRWTPNDLYEKFRQSQENPESTYTLQVGNMDVDEICNALTNEMTYNPVRFGTKSPFILYGDNNIVYFCHKYSNLKELQPEQSIYGQIALKLQDTLNTLNKYCPDFAQTGKLDSEFIDIYQPYGKKLHGYALLASLRDAIKIIIRQNQSDFKSSLKHRKVMKEIIESRHPNLKRSIKNPDFLALEPVNQQEKSITTQMSGLQNDIQRIQMYIDDINEYDNPVDISKQKILLEKQTAQYEKLEQELDKIRQKKQNILQKTR